MNHVEVLEAVPGLTFRQLDHWSRGGHVHWTYMARRPPVEALKHQARAAKYRATYPEPDRGSGTVRDWPASEIPVMQWMVLLTRKGTLGMSVADAERVARVIESGQMVELARLGECCLLLEGVRVREEVAS